MDSCIDTHTAIKKLEAFGFQTERAEVVTSLFSSRESELATKEDLKTAITGLRTELKADNAVLQEQINSTRIESRVVQAFVIAMLVPVFLQSFGLFQAAPARPFPLPQEWTKHETEARKSKE